MSDNVIKSLQLHKFCTCAHPRVKVMKNYGPTEWIMNKILYCVCGKEIRRCQE